jgi:hypothetical protein
VLATFGTGIQVNALKGGMRGVLQGTKELSKKRVIFFFAIADAKSEVMSAKKTFQLTQENATRGREQILEWFRNDHDVIR